MNKYGIRLDDNLFVLDINIFQELPKEYLEISEYQYLTYLKIWKPWSKYLKSELVNLPEDEKAYLHEKNKRDLRKQLENLHIQIGLSERMREDPKDLLADFERVKVLYNKLLK